MAEQVQALSNRFYRGVWGILARCFRVPQSPPALPTRPGEECASFKPAPGFLKYMKLKFWLGMVFPTVVILLGWAGSLAISPVAGLVAAPVAIILEAALAVVGYLAIHLRYDTTWYVMSPRSLRIRRGIWVIHETTITFENIQNVKIDQGPVQRLFGIADVLVETAGGGGSAAAGAEDAEAHGAHRGLIEGVAEAQEIRDLLLARMRTSRSAGLGDEPEGRSMKGTRWSPDHLAALREIRDAVVAMPGS
jgi:membrane protein YdbS with pleckstrin-like domain